MTPEPDSNPRLKRVFIFIEDGEYCGIKHTLPTSNDEVIANLFNRANNLWLKPPPFFRQFNLTSTNELPQKVLK